MKKETFDLLQFNQDQIRDIYFMIESLEKMEYIERETILKAVEIYKENNP